MKAVKRIFVIAAFALAWISALIFLLWAAGAVWHFDFLPRPVGPILAFVLPAFFVLLFFRLKRKKFWLTYAGGAITAVWLLLQLHQPTHDRDWAKDQTVLSHIQFLGDQVTIRNFRHNIYRSESDFDVHRSDYQFELSRLQKVWFIVQHFTTGEGLAHVFLTFEVMPEDGAAEHFSLSVEIRREADEFFSPIQGLYKQYELNYVFGDERDLIGVRTIMRPDDRVYMYPINATPNQVQELFHSIADRTNQIVERPEFYHTLLNNCMNGLLRHTVELTPEEISWFDPKILLPGHSDQFAYDKGIIGSAEQSFEDLKQQCRIDPIAREHGIQPGFSTAIRGFQDNRATEADTQ